MPDPALESTTSADGTTIGYLRLGAGPALVITHGSVSTSVQWIPAIEHLAEHFTCYVHDRRGRGRSGDAPVYGLATEVADIAAMMSVAGPGAHLLGHSYGALCTLAYAETHPLDGTLLLFEPPLAVDGPVAGPGLSTYRDLVAAGWISTLRWSSRLSISSGCLLRPYRRSGEPRCGTRPCRWSRPGSVSWSRSTRSATTSGTTPRSTRRST